MPARQVAGVGVAGLLRRAAGVGGQPAREQRGIDISMAVGAVAAAAPLAPGAQPAGGGGRSAVERGAGGCGVVVGWGRRGCVIAELRLQRGQMRQMRLPPRGRQGHQPGLVRFYPQHRRHRGAVACGPARLHQRLGLCAAGLLLRAVVLQPAARAAAQTVVPRLQRGERLAADPAAGSRRRHWHGGAFCALCRQSGIHRNLHRNVPTTAPLPAASDPLAGLAVFERGWLSSNNVLMFAAPGEPGALLVDSSHVNHAAQTLALVQAALAGRPLALLANTHLHSDHCGGNTLLQQALGVPVALPPGQAEVVQRWDESRLSHHATGQRLGRFTHQRLLQPGEELRAGGRVWEIIAAPGHDPDMVMLFDRAHGVLISADALWENGFGVIFPEIAGEPGFDDMHAVLDLIAGLPVRLVIPGHGRVFTDVGAALQRAGQRLQGFVQEPARHARHAMKVLLKYRLMEEREQALPVLQHWAAATPLVQGLWQRFAPAGVAGIDDWVQRLVAELAAAGVVKIEGQRVLDA